MTNYRTYFEDQWVVLQQAPLYRPEPNPTFENPPFAEADWRALIVRLSPYRDVARSTPHLFLYQAIRRALPRAYIDMAFFPPQHDRARWREAGVPFLVGAQSFRSAEEFDAVLISNAYTLELINLPYLLLNAGLPVWASERDARFPPLLLGGSNALASQGAISESGDSFVDAIFFGEGEGAVERLVRALHAHAQASKHERLRRAADEVPALWLANEGEQQVIKAVRDAPTREDLLTAYPLLDSEEAATARLQINFGCPAFCAFCFEGYDRKPYREAPLDDVLVAADALKRAQGPEAVDVYSFNFNTHADILALLPALNRRFARVNLKSQRVDLLARVPGLLEAEVAADKRRFTLGIEGISRRMRAYLHKSLTDAEIESLLARLLKQKIREIKLFYILTGHETAADLAEFHDFVLLLKALRRRHHRGLRVIFSFGLLVRMPFTPLRYDALFLDDVDEVAWRQITGPAQASCETNGFEFRLATPWAEYATSQVLALGGYWLAAPMLALAREGYCYDMGLQQDGAPYLKGDAGARYWDALRAWMKARDLWGPAFLGEKGADYLFPLSFVEQRISADFLYEQYRCAVMEEDTGYCLGLVSQGRCLGCGACVDPGQRQAITGHVMQRPTGDFVRELDELMHEKWRLPARYARIWLPPWAFGADPAWVNAYVMRALLRADPALTKNLLQVQEAIFSHHAHRERYPVLAGETCFALTAWAGPKPLRCAAWEPAALAMIEEGAMLPGGVRFLGWEEDVAPEDLRRMTLRLTLRADPYPQAGHRLRKFFHAAYVPVNLRRIDPAALPFEVGDGRAYQ
ncbi:MAG: radical SAM protein, partial [Anaerolineales bacterium]